MEGGALLAHLPSPLPPSPPPIPTRPYHAIVSHARRTLPNSLHEPRVNSAYQFLGDILGSYVAACHLFLALDSLTRRLGYSCGEASSVLLFRRMLHLLHQSRALQFSWLLANGRYLVCRNLGFSGIFNLGHAYTLGLDFQ
jgi:hypothetical protein